MGTFPLEYTKNVNGEDGISGLTVPKPVSTDDTMCCDITVDPWAAGNRLINHPPRESLLTPSKPRPGFIPKHRV